MVETANRKVTVSDLTIALRSGRPALQNTDEIAIPSDYWVMPEPRLDRQSLATELKNGAQVPGVCLGNHRRCSVSNTKVSHTQRSAKRSAG